MAIKYYERYPQRWESPSQDYPQGAFKNLSALGEQDGSYLEKDWLNDKSGFFGALLRNAEMTPNGLVDTAQKSQFYDALVAVAKKVVGEEGYRKLDNNEFEGFIQVRATDDTIGAGVILMDSSGKPRGQMTYNSDGLQFAQHSSEGSSETYTLPSVGGELLTDDRISQSLGSSSDKIASQKSLSDLSLSNSQVSFINYLETFAKDGWTVEEALEEASSFCSEKGKALIVDKDVALTRSIHLLSDTHFKGTVSANVVDNPIQIYLDSSSAVIQGSATVEALEGGVTIQGLPNECIGNYVKISSNEVLTERDNPDGVPYLKNSCFRLLNSAGRTNITFDTSYNGQVQYTVSPLESRMHVSFTDFVITGASTRAIVGIVVTRDNVRIDAPIFKVSESLHVHTLINVQGSNTVINGGYLTGHTLDGYGYGISIATSCDTLVCGTVFGVGRTDIDGRHGYNVELRNILASTVGSHWGVNYTIQDSQVGVVTWAGMNLTIRRSSFDYLALRGDVGGMSLGTLHIEESSSHSAASLMQITRPVKKDFYTTPRRHFDKVYLKNISAHSITSLTVYNRAEYFTADYSLPKEFEITDCDIREECVLPIYMLPSVKGTLDKLTIQNIDSTLQVVVSGSSHSSDLVGKINNVKEVDIRADANSFKEFEVRNCLVSKLWRINAPSVPNRGVINMHSCTYNPTAPNSTEASTSYTNCILDGTNLNNASSATGSILYSIGNILRKGAQGFPVDPKYFVNPNF